MIEITGLQKSFGQKQILKDINLSLKQGQVTAVIGPSGTGKSTLLRCVNYLTRPDAGCVTIDGFSVEAKRATSRDIHKLRRYTSMVFQNYNLLFNLTALHNVMEPMITVQKIPRREAQERALELLRKVGVEDRRDAYPRRMSGGEQQRVAIARALAVNAKVMLLDEPTSSLDPELVGGILGIIRQLAQEHTTMVIVTHEMRFAREVADRIIFLEDGYIAGDGTPEAIFARQDNPRIQKFISSLWENR